MISVDMVVGMDVMQYVVVGVGPIQRIHDPKVHNPRKLIIFIGQLGVKSSFFIISIKLNTAKITSKKNIGNIFLIRIFIFSSNGIQNGEKREKEGSYPNSRTALGVDRTLKLIFAISQTMRNIKTLYKSC